MKPREIFEILADEVGLVPDNEEEAQKWFKEAFLKGSDRVKEAILELLSYDVVRPKDENERIWWIFNSVLFGNFKHKKNLRQLYYEGHGEEKLRKEILSYLRKDAKKNEDIDSMIFMGHVYTSGMGVEKDGEEAQKWYKKAADKGDGGAQLAVAEHHFNKEEYQDAYKWYVKAAQNDKKTAFIRLSLMHKKGLGTPESKEKALHYLTLLKNGEKFRPPVKKSQNKNKNKK